MLKRKLGHLKISAMGLGCWAIGGVWWSAEGRPSGWGQVDDAESIRAVRRALELDITFFDTADRYGCGHSERVLAQALTGRREQVVIATKFGGAFDEQTRQQTGYKADPDYVRGACEASLRRLNTDYIDLYQFHWSDYDPARAWEVRDVLEELVAEGKIRYYGWSTDDLERARVFAQGEHCVAIQHVLNIMMDNGPMLALCDEFNLASIIKAPFLHGILTGKFNTESKLPEDDMRHRWDFQTGRPAEILKQLDLIRDVLTSDGRTLAQAALGWIWARSARAIPIPGFKTVKQVEENVKALEFGPLTDEQMQEIDTLLGRA